MSVRPYPSRARTLRQIMRRHGNQLPAHQLPAHLLPAPRAPQGPAGEYRLSTRRER